MSLLFPDAYSCPLDPVGTHVVILQVASACPGEVVCSIMARVTGALRRNSVAVFSTHEFGTKLCTEVMTSLRKSRCIRIRRPYSAFVSGVSKVVNAHMRGSVAAAAVNFTTENHDCVIVSPDARTTELVVTKICRRHRLVYCGVEQSRLSHNYVQVLPSTPDSELDECVMRAVTAPGADPPMTPWPVTSWDELRIDDENEWWGQGYGSVDDFVVNDEPDASQWFRHTESKTD